MPPKTELDYFLDFLKSESEREKLNEVSKDNGDKKDSRNKKEKFKSEVPTAAELHVNQAKNRCIFCAKNHDSKECGQSNKLTLEEKIEKVEKSRACYRCLRMGHGSKKCKVFVKCLACHRDHQTIMCPQLYGHESQEKICKEETTTVPVSVNFTKGVLFETLSVRLIGQGGVAHKARVFLDRGSARSFIKGSTAKLLKYPSKGVEIFQKELLGGVLTGPKKHNLYDVQMESLNGRNLRKIRLTEQDPMICNLPLIPDGPWIHELREMKINLTDFNYSSSSDIDILLGADVIPSIMTKKTVNLKCGIVASETVFGWVLLGPIAQTNLTIATKVLCGHLNDITKFWDLDILGIRDPIEVKTDAQKEEEARKSFAQNVTREPDGRYSVSLPWAEGKEDLPSYRKVAEKRLENVTHSLKAKGKFEIYDQVFRSWEKEGIIEEVQDQSDGCHYLPHRPVFKESATTPVRPVFDASCRVGAMPALNDCLYKGPNMIELIPSLLMKFREKKIGVVADIRKAFQMVSICAMDRDYQMFLWWNNQKQIKVYRHTRVVFGISSSPFLLAATIKHHLENVPEEQREFAQVLCQNFYVDNCLTSVRDLHEYEDFKNQATEIMREAQMELREWECSCDDATSDLNVSTVLGLEWNKKDDTLGCFLPEPPEKLTKRAVLSQVHRIFDPIGFTCPATLVPKMILQDTWNLKIDWDEELPEEQKIKFEKWIKELPSLKNLKIPRQFRFAQNIQVHVFVDASKGAYAAVIYIRSVGGDGVKVQLIEAKNRVAPLKKPPPTIPRLELLSCLIGSRLVGGVKDALKLKITPIFFGRILPPL